jgi:4-hydroxybutyrate dehydrogenase
VLGTLAAECEKANIHRPLIVTDQGVKAVGILQKALDALPGVPVAVFDDTPSNPTEAAVRAAVKVYHAHQCDGLIALGGGSSIDCAKGVAIAATHEGPLKTYATIEGGSLKITPAVCPLIAVPTTAGTGRFARPRAHPRFAPCPYCGYWHGRDCALHGNFHGCAIQPTC